MSSNSSSSLIQRAKVVARGDEIFESSEANVTSSFVMDGQGFDEYDVPVHASEADEEFERLERDLQRLNSQQQQHQSEWNHQRGSSQMESQYAPNVYGHNNDDKEEALPSESASAIYHQPQMALSEPERQLAELVQSKVAALNAQIERYTAELNRLSEASAALANDRAKLDEEAKALSKEKHEFKAWRDSEHNRFETWRNELTAKMDKERRVAVRQARASAAAMNALPDRQERAELENLKKELGKVKAELSASEAKYKSAVDRHRAGAAATKDQITQLEAQIRKYEEERIAIVFGPNAVTSTHPQQTSHSVPHLPSNVATVDTKKIKKQQQNGTNSSVLVQRTAPPPPPPPPHLPAAATVSPIDTEQRESDIWAENNQLKSQNGYDMIEAEKRDDRNNEDGYEVEGSRSVETEQVTYSEDKGVIEDEYMDALLGRTAALRNANSNALKVSPALTPAGISGSVAYNPARYSSSAKATVDVPISSSTTVFAPPAPTRLSGAPNAHVKEIPTEMHMLGSSSSIASTSTADKSSSRILASGQTRTPSTAIRLPAMQPLSALMGSQSDAPAHELDKKADFVQAPSARMHALGAPISRSLRAHLETRLTPRELGLGVAESGRVALVQQTEVEGPSGKTEMRFADGSRVVRFRNGTEKEQRPGGVSIVRFNNGDIKRSVPRDVTEGGGVVDSYFYASAGTLQTTYPHGIDVFEFPNGQIELHDSIASLKEILFNDGSVRSVHLNAGENSNGSTIIPTDMNY